MSDKPPTATTAAAGNNCLQTWTGGRTETTPKHEGRAAIGGTWGTFSEYDPFDLDDGVRRATYDLAKDIAQRDIAAFRRAVAPVPATEWAGQNRLRNINLWRDSMSTRSTEVTIRFSQAFRLSQFDQAQPAGSYQLVTEEERLEGLSFAAFQRVRTLLHLPGNARPGRTRQVVEVDPAELAAAVVADALRDLGMRAALTA